MEMFEIREILTRDKATRNRLRGLRRPHQASKKKSA
jgi:hypothetical protein